MADDKQKLAIVQMTSPYTFVGALENSDADGITLKDPLTVWYPVNPGEVLRLTAHFVADGMLNVGVKGKTMFIPMNMVEFITTINADSIDDPVTAMYRDFFLAAEPPLQ